MSATEHNGNDGFGIPEGYEDRFARNLRQRIAVLGEIRDYPKLCELKGNPPFKVPDGYFERRLPLLHMLHLQRTIFKVPEVYFESAEEKLKAVTAAGPGKTVDDEIRIRPERGTGARIRKLNPRSWMAAAAVLVVTLAAWLISSDRTDVRDTPQDCLTVACLEKREVIESKTLESLNDDELYQLIDLEKLEQDLGLPENNQHENQTNSPAPKT